MRILAYGDLHFVNKTKFYSHLKVCIETCEFITSQVLHYKPKYVINLGDTFHHYWIDTPTLNAAFKSMQKISHACQEIDAVHIILIGNHDGYHAESETDMCTTFEELPNTVIIRKPFLTEDGISLIPYTTPERIREALAKLEGKSNIIFTHNEIIGASLTPQLKEHRGILPSEFLAFKLVINGHYHHPHAIGHIHNAGSTLYHNFSDHQTDIPRGTLLIDPEKHSVSVSENPVTPIYLKTEVYDQMTFARFAKITHKARTIVRVEVEEGLREAIEALRDEFRGMYLVSRKEGTTPRVEIPSISTAPELVVAQYIESITDTVLSRARLKDLGFEILANS